MPTHARSLFARALATEEPGEGDPVARRILDGGLARFSETGLTRSTVEDVARHAGVSRVTVYRRFATKTLLVQAVLLRECRRFLLDLDATLGALGTLEERVVEGFTFALRYAREHPLVGGMLRVEPETVLPFLTIRAGDALHAVREYLAEHIRYARDSGEPGKHDLDPEPVAEIMIRVAVSFVITADSTIPLTTDHDARAFARRYLVPLVNGSPT